MNSTREGWLDVVRAAGKNGTVMSERQGVQRVVLGQYQFVLAQDAYVRQTLAKDPSAPVASKYFQDYNELNGVYYFVRTNTPSPAAAALWVLWMTTPEAEAIWQPSNLSFQPYGSSKIDKEGRQQKEESNAPIVGFLDNDKTVALLRWKSSPAGTEYLGALAKAIQGE